jgi:hypothetical protein
MALEAGGAMHEVFSFVRLASLVGYLEAKGKDQQFIDHAVSLPWHTTVWP